MTDTDTSPPPLHRPKRLLAILVVLVAVGGLGYRWWWGQSHISTDNAQVEGRLIPVLAKVGGYVTKVAFEEHQPVKAGDLLVQIDERDYRAKLAQAEADLQMAIANAGRDGKPGQAAAQLAASRASAAAARSAIEAAQANADRAARDLDRARGLVERKMIPPQQLDAAEAAQRAALAQLRMARESAASSGEMVGANDAALRAAQAKVESLQAARDLAAQALADARVVAPATGMTSRRGVEPGQFVQPGQPLVAVVPLDDIWIVANFKETQIHDFKPEIPVDIEVDAYPGLVLHGKVDSLSPATGARFSLLPPDNATGNFTKVVQRVPVKIRVAQNSDAARPLRPGMSVSVTVITR